jgi:hypothetical protein
MGILMRRWQRGVTAFALMLACAAAQAQGAPSEATVKAAFLYKFAGYVEWPASAFPQPDAPLVIGVVGADEVAAELEKLLPGRQVNNRRVVARRVREGEPLRGIHLLFVGRGERDLRAALRAAQQQGVLAVSEAERGLELGSAINFVVVDDRVGFEVSLDSAERSGIRISSRMLAVARRVIPRS